MVEGVFADQEVVGVFLALQEAGADDIDLVQLVGVVGLRPWIVGVGRAPRQAERGTGQVAAFQDPLDTERCTDGLRRGDPERCVDGKS